MVRLFRKMRGSDDESVPRRRSVSEGTPEGNGRPTPSRFSRNRTITGSRSNDVSSVRLDNDGSRESSRVRVRHLHKHRRRLGRWLVAVLIIVCVLIWVMYQFVANVQVVTASDLVRTIPVNKYQRLMENYLDGHPLQRFRSLLNTAQLESYISQGAPEVSAVRDISSNGIGSAQVSIEFRRPIASWVINGTTYYVDKYGVKFSDDYYGSPNVKVEDNNANSFIGTSAGEVATGTVLKFIGQSIDAANQFGIHVKEAIIPTGTVHEVDLSIKGHKYVIKLSTDQPAGDQMENASRTMTYLHTHGLNPSYIDVRIPGRAYYR